jgi:hypothetical protein
MTIEMWINPTSVGSQQPLAEWNNGVGGMGAHFWISVQSPGSLQANLVDTNGVSHGFFTPTGSIAANVYQHVAVTYDKPSGLLAFFINGVQAASTNLGSFTPDTRSDLYLGLRPSGVAAGTRYAGTMDEVSVYNRALATNEIAAIYHAGAYGKCSLAPTAPLITQQPISQNAFVGDPVSFGVTATGTMPLFYQWLYNGNPIIAATNTTLTLNNVQTGNAGNYSVIVSNLAGAVTSSNAFLSVSIFNPLTNGMAAYYPFNGNANDASGHGKNGVNNGATLTVDRFGTASSAYAFNGSSYISVDTNRPLTGLHTNFTISLWFRANDTSPGDMYVHRANFRDINLNWSRGTPLEPGKVLMSIYDNTSTYHEVTSGVLPTNTWIHCVTTYDGLAQRLYINGVQVSSASWSAPLNWDDSFIGEGIGGFAADNTYRFNGDIDDVRVYGRTLSPSDVARLYASEAPAAPTITNQPASQIVNVGQSVSFNASATGTSPLSYQWSFDGTNIVNATNVTLTLVNVQPTDAGNFAVTVSNPYGSTNSINASLTVNWPPVANSATYTRNAGLALKIDVNELLTDFTSDSDGNARSATGFGTPAHGSLNQIGNWLLYTPNVNDDTNDAFSYSITDGFGGYATNTITVTVITPGGVVKIAQPAGESITLNLAGIPGVAYDIERSTDMSNWTVVGTVTAPAHGVFSFTDTNPPQPSAYYRMKQH